MWTLGYPILVLMAVGVPRPDRISLFHEESWRLGDERLERTLDSLMFSCRKTERALRCQTAGPYEFCRLSFTLWCC